MVRRQAAAVGLVEIGALRDADQRVVGLVHVGPGEEDVVGRDQRHVVAIGPIEKHRLGAPLGLGAVALQLDIEAILEGIAQGAEQLLGSGRAAILEQPPERPLGASAQDQHALAMGAEIGEAHLRLVLGLALQERLARELEQIAVSDVALRQQEDGVGVPPPAALDRFGEVQERPDDGLHAALHARGGELQHPEHVAGVGDRDGRHRMLPAQPDDLGDGERALRQGKGRMNAEVNEVGVRHPVRGTGAAVAGRQGSTCARPNHRERLQNLPICCGLLLDQHTIL